jgi:hypothetical protein
MNNVIEVLALLRKHSELELQILNGQVRPLKPPCRIYMAVSCGSVPTRISVRCSANTSTR